MLLGNAFNRSEVSSESVTPDSRFVVSIISGDSASRTPQEAAALLLKEIEARQVAIRVFDRETGETTEII